MPKFTRTFYVPGDSLGEWLAIQVPANTNDRLSIVPAPLGKSPNALRVQVRDGDVAVNSQGQPIPGGWRAEGVGPTEVASPNPARYTWSTMLDPAYPVNATGTDGKPIWQVITQWHQGDQDVGGPPPIAFIIVGDQILLHLHRSDPQNPANSIEVGQFPVANGLARGSWHDFQMDVRWDLTNGWVTVWHNGQLMQHHGPIQTLFPQQQNPGAAGSTYLKMGLYRKAVPTATAGDFVLYHDEVQRFDASFAPVYQQGDPGTGIGGYDLARPSTASSPSITTEAADRTISSSTGRGPAPSGSCATSEAGSRPSTSKVIQAVALAATTWPGPRTGCSRSTTTAAADRTISSSTARARGPSGSCAVPPGAAASIPARPGPRSTPAARHREGGDLRGGRCARPPSGAGGRQRRRPPSHNQVLVA
jgi:hypothetical protein